MALGEELVTNGGFDADISGWTDDGGGNWDWDVLGKASYYAVGPGAAYLQQSLDITAGKSYQVSVVLSNEAIADSDDFVVFLGGTQLSSSMVNGSISENVICGETDTLLKFYSDSPTPEDSIKIDDVSVKEILGGAALSSDMLGVFLEGE